MFRSIAKTTAGIFGGLLVLLVLAAAGVVLMIDPNNYKDQINRQIQEKTGLPFSIRGDIYLFLFPWIGGDIGRIILDNPKEFGDAPMLRASRSRIRVKLLPLLNGRWEADKILLENAEAHLIRNSSGKGNWETVFELSDGTAENDRSPAEARPLMVNIDGIEINESRLVWEDRTRNRRFEATDIRVETDDMAPGEPFDADAAATVSSDDPKLSATLTCQANISLSHGDRRLSLKDMTLRIQNAAFTSPASAEETGETLSGDADITGDVRADWGERNISVPQLNIRATARRRSLSAEIDMRAGAAVQWETGRIKLNSFELDGDATAEATDLAVKALSSAVTANWKDGAVEISGLDATGRAKGEGVPGGEAPFSLTGDASLNWKAETASIADMKASVYSDLKVTGRISGKRLFSEPELTGHLTLARCSPRSLMRNMGVTPPADLAADALSTFSADFDFSAGFGTWEASNLNAEIDGATVTGGAAAEGFRPLKATFDLDADDLNADRYLPRQSGRGDDASDDAGEWKTPPILKTMTLDGDLHAGRLRLYGAEAADVSLGVSVRKGTIRLDPLSAGDLYGGELAAGLTADAAKDAPDVDLTWRWSDIDPGRLIKAFSNSDPVKGGTATLDVELNSRGRTRSAMLADLNGRGEIRTGAAVIKGVNIPSLIRLTGYPFRSLLRKLGVSRDIPNRMSVKPSSAAFDVKDGTLTTDHMALRSADGVIVFNGALHLADLSLDGELDVIINDVAAVPMKVSGSLIHPELTEKPAGIILNTASNLVKLPFKFGKDVITNPGETAMDIITAPWDIGAGFIREGLLGVTDEVPPPEKQKPEQEGENQKEPKQDTGPSAP